MNRKIKKLEEQQELKIEKILQARVLTEEILIIENRLIFHFGRIIKCGQFKNTVLSEEKGVTIEVGDDENSRRIRQNELLAFIVREENGVILLDWEIHLGNNQHIQYVWSAERRIELLKTLLHSEIC